MGCFDFERVLQSIEERFLDHWLVKISKSALRGCQSSAQEAITFSAADTVQELQVGFAALELFGLTIVTCVVHDLPNQKSQ